jgi:hypothetical protein
VLHVHLFNGQPGGSPSSNASWRLLYLNARTCIPHSSKTFQCVPQVPQRPAMHSFIALGHGQADPSPWQPAQSVSQRQKSGIDHVPLSKRLRLLIQSETEVRLSGVASPGECVKHLPCTTHSRHRRVSRGARYYTYICLL